VVAEAVHERGWAVLNADDDLVYDMRNNVKCKVALFSLHGNSPRIEEHCKRGGVACFTDDQYIILRQGVHQYRRIQKINHIPITMEGRAVFNIYNVLAAVLAAHAVGCTTEQIKNTLFTFSNNAKDTPGRVNMFRINNSQVLVDYAHNPHGLRAIGTLISSYKDQQKVGILTGVGDRRDEDIIAYGKIAGEIFDVVIIRFDKDTRGRGCDEIAHLLKVGIQDSGNNPHVLQIDEEIEALDYAINVYNDNTLIFLGAENIEKVIEFLNKKQSTAENATVVEQQSTLQVRLQHS
jgi:cyanophycin synthetase